MQLLMTRAALKRSLANNGDFQRDGAAMEDGDVPNLWDYS